jgi:hypothetical protein
MRMKTDPRKPWQSQMDKWDLCFSGAAAALVYENMYPAKSWSHVSPTKKSSYIPLDPVKFLRGTRLSKLVDFTDRLRARAQTLQVSWVSKQSKKQT